MNSTRRLLRLTSSSTARSRPKVDKEQNDQALIDKWKKEIYEDSDIKKSGKQYCFESLATGFFMAQSKTNEEASDLYQKCVEQGCF